MKLIIIGGVAGGASAAARARRVNEAAEILVFERGEYMSFANCGLPYHVGKVIENRQSLVVMTPERFKARTNIEVRTLSEVVAINPATHTVTVKDLRTGTSYEETYDKLILATGSSPVRPPIPGADDPDVMVLWTLADVDRIKQRVDAGIQRAVVIGAGFIGLEVAENLRLRGVETSLVEMLPQVLPPFDPEMTAPLADTLRQQGIQLFLSNGVTRINRSRVDENTLGKEITVELKDGTVLTADLVVMGVGVRPNSELAKAAGLTLGARGGIAVNAQLQTSHPDIFAVGDAIQVTDPILGGQVQIPLAGPANRQGRLAADNAFGAKHAYKGTYGTAIVKLFDWTAANVGASEKVLLKAGTAYRKVYLEPFSHATYYPGSKMLYMKLLFAPDGKLLGAQIVGQDGVDKRIDVLATALQAGLTVYDLEELELAYAPPYGAAKDPVNFAGFIAANLLRGDTVAAYPDALPPGALLLDVREPDEVAAGALAGALAMPLGKLRGRLAELPKDREIVIYCRVGLRGYIAERILKQRGFNVKNLSGGYLAWELFQPRSGAGAPPAPTAKNLAPCAAAPGAVVAAPAAAGCGQSATLQQLDVSGLQCPGPIVAVKNALMALTPGQMLTVKASDPGFMKDLPAWCESTGNPLISIKHENGGIVAVVGRGAAPSPAALMAASACAGAGAGPKRTTLIMFSNDLDRAMAGFILATGFATLGHEVTLFFTFWGLNILRKDPPPGNVKKDILSRMFGFMMPRGATRLTLSKMHMLGMGTAMMKYVMNSKQVTPLPELIAQAQKQGVKFVACEMAMGVMGLQKAELLDGVDTAGVASFAALAEKSGTTLFL